MDLLNSIAESSRQSIKKGLEQVACPIGYIVGGTAIGGIAGSAFPGPGTVIGAAGGAAVGVYGALKNCSPKDRRVSTHHQTKHSLTSPSSEFARKTLEKASSKQTLTAAETQAFGHIIQSGLPKVPSLAAAQLAMPQVRTAIQKQPSKA